MGNPIPVKFSPSDEILMQAIAGGDLAAFEQLVVRHQEFVWRTAYRVLGCHRDAEDIAQEAFLKVFQARERYRPTAAFRTYLLRIVVRLCLDHLRKGRPLPAENLAPVDRYSSAEQQVVDHEQAEAVRAAISCLPAKQRTAVVLRYYEALKGREIAEAMDTTAKAVERLLARARKSLENRLSEFFRD